MKNAVTKLGTGETQKDTSGEPAGEKREAGHGVHAAALPMLYVETGQRLADVLPAAENEPAGVIEQESTAAANEPPSQIVQALIDVCST